MKCVVFRIGSEEYGIDIECIKGIEDKVSVSSVPNRPSYILGIISLRGEVIPVFSLRKKFGKEETNDEFARLIVVSLNDNKVAFKVDEVTKIVDVEDNELHDIPTICQSEDTKYAKSVAKIEGGLVVVLDVEDALDDEQKKQLKEVAKDNQ